MIIFIKKIHRSQLQNKLLITDANHSDVPSIIFLILRKDLRNNPPTIFIQLSIKCGRDMKDISRQPHVRHFIIHPKGKVRSCHDGLMRWVEREGGAPELIESRRIDDVFVSQLLKYKITLIFSMIRMSEWVARLWAWEQSDE